MTKWDIVAKNIRGWRKIKGLTQKQVAEKSGVSQLTISNTGHYAPGCVT